MLNEKKDCVGELWLDEAINADAQRDNNGRWQAIANAQQNAVPVVKTPQAYPGLQLRGNESPKKLKAIMQCFSYIQTKFPDYIPIPTDVMGDFPHPGALFSMGHEADYSCFVEYGKRPGFRVYLLEPLTDGCPYSCASALYTTRFNFHCQTLHEVKILIRAVRRIQY